MRAPTRGAPTSVLGRRAGHVIEELLQGAIAQRVCLDHSLLRLIVEPYFFLRAFGLAQVSGYICHAVVSLDGVRSETDTRLHLGVRLLPLLVPFQGLAQAAARRGVRRHQAGRLLQLVLSACRRSGGSLIVLHSKLESPTVSQSLRLIRMAVCVATNLANRSRVGAARLLQLNLTEIVESQLRLRVHPRRFEQLLNGLRILL